MDTTPSRKRKKDTTDTEEHSDRKRSKPSTSRRPRFTPLPGASSGYSPAVEKLRETAAGVLRREDLQEGSSSSGPKDTPLPQEDLPRRKMKPRIKGEGVPKLNQRVDMRLAREGRFLTREATSDTNTASNIEQADPSRDTIDSRQKDEFVRGILPHVVYIFESAKGQAAKSKSSKKNLYKRLRDACDDLLEEIRPSTTGLKEFEYAFTIKNALNNVRPATGSELDDKRIEINTLYNRIFPEN